jgi:hypothetical protein
MPSVLKLTTPVNFVQALCFAQNAVCQRGTFQRLPLVERFGRIEIHQGRRLLIGRSSHNNRFAFMSAG